MRCGNGLTQETDKLYLFPEGFESSPVGMNLFEEGSGQWENLRLT